MSSVSLACRESYKLNKRKETEMTQVIVGGTEEKGTEIFLFIEAKELSLFLQ